MESTCIPVPPLITVVPFSKTSAIPVFVTLLIYIPVPLLVTEPTYIPVPVLVIPLVIFTPMSELSSEEVITEPTDIPVLLLVTEPT